MPKKENMEFNRTEYVIKSTTPKGESFVANAFQMDIEQALKVFQAQKKSLITKTMGAVITMERHRIRTIVEPYTEIAEKMLKG